MDLGIYGWSPLPTWAGKDPTLRMFEKFTLKHGGYQVLSCAIQKACKDIWGYFQGLYADTLMSFEEFFQMFSEFGEAYAKVKIETAWESARDKNTRDTRAVIFLNIII